MYKPANNWVKLGELKNHPQIRNFLDIALSNIPENLGYDGITVYKNPKDQNIMFHHFGRYKHLAAQMDPRLIKIFDKNDFNFVFRVQRGKTEFMPYGHVIVKPYQSSDEYTFVKMASNLGIGPSLIMDKPIANPLLKNSKDGMIIEQYLSATEGWHPLYLSRKTVARPLAVKAVFGLFETIHSKMKSVYFKEGVDFANSYPKVWASEAWKHILFNTITAETRIIDFGSTSIAKKDMISKESMLVKRLLSEMDTHNF